MTGPVIRGRAGRTPLPSAALRPVQRCKRGDIFRSQVSALRSLVRVFSYRCGCRAKFRSWTCTRTRTP